MSNEIHSFFKSIAISTSIPEWGVTKHSTFKRLTAAERVDAVRVTTPEVAKVAFCGFSYCDAHVYIGFFSSGSM